MKGTTQCSRGGIYELDDQPAEHAPRVKREPITVGQLVTIYASQMQTKVELYEVIDIDDDGVGAVLKPLAPYASNAGTMAAVEVDVFCLRPWEKKVPTTRLCRYCDARKPHNSFRQGLKCRACEAREARARHSGSYVSLRKRMNDEIRKAG